MHSHTKMQPMSSYTHPGPRRTQRIGQPLCMGASSCLVEVVVPVYNEAHVLVESIRRLHSYLSSSSVGSFQITIANNASTDATADVACTLAGALPEVRVINLAHKGRGLALRSAWEQSKADVVAYMDVDLSTDLGAFPDLISPLLTGECDVAFGSRLTNDSEVTRGLKREFISRSYNRLLRRALHVSFSDAQCGFKAARRVVVQQLLPQIEDNNWFFDTELLYRAQEHQLRLHEVPVHWVDDPDSRVHVVSTALEDLRGIKRLRAQKHKDTQQQELPSPVRQELAW